jgi:hypothetical protein
VPKSAFVIGTRFSKTVLLMLLKRFRKVCRGQ